MKIYKWGILAPGKIAHQFAKGLSVLPNAKLFAVASRSIERATDFAKLYNADRAYGSYEQLVNDPDVDIIYIAPPHNLHYEFTKICLLGGKHVLCEKPITLNFIQFAELAEVAREKKLFYMDALWTRFLPSIRKAIDIVNTGEIGDLKSIRADFGIHPLYDPESRLFNKELGGGSILDIGIYPAFLSLLFLGYPDQIKVLSVLGTTGVDESCSMIFKYKNGAMANLFSTLLANTDTSAEIAGTKGRIQIARKWFKPSAMKVIFDDTREENYDFDIRMNVYVYEAGEVMLCLDKGLTESVLP
jgi:predicted dehydrogenase